MVDRGTVFILQPDVYPKHAALVERLRRLPGWEEVEPEAPEAAEDRDAEKPSGSQLLPHQAEAIERIKQQHRDLLTESEP